MKRIIVPTGYMGSGSSAITGLLSEFKNCSNEYKSFEYIFLYYRPYFLKHKEKPLYQQNLSTGAALRATLRGIRNNKIGKQAAAQQKQESTI